jgi:hypothetical protein
LLEALTIIRIEQTEEATFGALLAGGRILCVTLELPWRGNQRNVSCIPHGIYNLRRRASWSRSREIGHTYEVDGVPGRSGILFHPGNTAEDIEGCIAPGTYVAQVNGHRGVARSLPAYKKLIQHIDTQAQPRLVVTQIII